MTLFKHDASLRKLFTPSFRRQTRPQCRFIRLMRATFSRNAGFIPNDATYHSLGALLYPSRIKIDLYLGDLSSKRTVTVRGALQHYLRPGVILYPMDPSPLDYIRPQYRLEKIDQEYGPMGVLGRSGSNMAEHRSSREVLLDVQSGREAYKQAMWCAWHILASRRHAEFQLYSSTLGFAWNVPVTEASLKGIINETPHLRPDIMLASLPALSGIVVKPQTNSKKIRFIIGPYHDDGQGNRLPPRDMTELFRQRHSSYVDELAEKARKEVKSPVGGKLLARRVKVRQDLPIDQTLYGLQPDKWNAEESESESEWSHSDESDAKGPTWI